MAADSAERSAIVPTSRTTPANPSARRAQARTAVLWSALRGVLDAGPARDVLDIGGGTGGFAVPIAELGHRVVVVDPSPDALAALERRAAESGRAAGSGTATGSLRAVQGDLAGLLDLVEPGSVDLVLCHGVLEMTDDPAGGLKAAAAALRPGGVASVLVANRTAAVVARAIGGHFAEARRALEDPRGRFGAQDPLDARFDEPQLRALLEGAGLTVQSRARRPGLHRPHPGRAHRRRPARRGRPGRAGGRGVRPAGVPGGRQPPARGGPEGLSRSGPFRTPVRGPRCADPVTAGEAVRGGPENAGRSTRR